MEHARILADSLEVLLARSPLFAGLGLEAYIIANPSAGGFTRPPIWRQHLREFQALEAEARRLPARSGKTSVELFLTERSQHAAELTRALLSRVALYPAGTLGLIVTAGGDGTSQEVLTELMEAIPEIRERVVVLRLPLGTGNDGSDGWTLSESLGRLIRPASIGKQRALRASIPGMQKPHYAFNIVSLGLDAYVTHMTNELKRKYPGNSYKLWLNVATLLYDKAFHVSAMHLWLLGKEDRAEAEYIEPYLLVAFGESGHRTYGSHTHILPTDDNLIFIRQMSVFRKIAIAGQCKKGTQAKSAEVRMATADKVKIDYKGEVLIQYDGEAFLLKPENFPLTLERTEPVIKVIRYAE
jgi:diacylglycerol kinase family enzyme